MLESGKPSNARLHDSIVTSANKVKLGTFEERFINKQFVN